MLGVKIIRACYVSGVARQPGDFLTVTDAIAIDLLNGNRAVLASESQKKRVKAFAPGREWQEWNQGERMPRPPTWAGGWRG
jgi:hypothetical protein